MRAFNISMGAYFYSNQLRQSSCTIRDWHCVDYLAGPAEVASISLWMCQMALFQGQANLPEVLGETQENEVKLSIDRYHNKNQATFFHLKQRADCSFCDLSLTL